MVVVGVIAKFVPTKPVFQVYVIAPLALSVPVLPRQNDAGFELMLILKALPMVTLTVLVFTQPKELPVTV